MKENSIEYGAKKVLIIWRDITCVGEK